MSRIEDKHMREVCKIGQGNDCCDGLDNKYEYKRKVRWNLKKEIQ